MVELAVVAVALVAMFAVKAVAIAKTRDELVQKQVAFSWVDPREAGALPVQEAEQRETVRATAPASLYARRARVA